jgi:hypothetical protein
MAKIVPWPQNKFRAVNLVEFQTDPLPAGDVRCQQNWHLQAQDSEAGPKILKILEWAHFPSRGKAKNSPSLPMMASAFGARVLGHFGHGSAVGGVSLRSPEREIAAPGITPFQKWRLLPA